MDPDGDATGKLSCVFLAMARLCYWSSYYCHATISSWSEESAGSPGTDGEVVASVVKGVAEIGMAEN